MTNRKGEIKERERRKESEFSLFYFQMNGGREREKGTGGGDNMRGCVSNGECGGDRQRDRLKSTHLLGEIGNDR